MIKPHGGTLVDKVLSRIEGRKILQDRTIPRLIVDYDTLLDLENIAVGAYSPLEGFMTEEEFRCVLAKNRLPNNLAWAIPIVLPSLKKHTKSFGRNTPVLLCNEGGIPIGVIQVKDIYSIDKDRVSKRVFGTSKREHPGVNRLFRSGDIFIGGEIGLIRKNSYPFHHFNLEPREVRRLIKTKKWKTIAGFQTRNIPHRAHEFLQKTALSIVDGLLIHPIVGWKKQGDFNPEVIIKSYEILIKYYYPQERVIFSGLATAMRYAGPQEAVFHAIIRKNFGCTHFIVGRDHAGVGGFYDTYAAHRIFDRFPDLGIMPLFLRGPYYCAKCGGIVNDKICPHTDTAHRKEISGTFIRNMLSKNKKIPGEYLRSEVSDFIFEHRDTCFI